jgi:hypothetical protein
MEITYKVEAKCNEAKGINVEFKGISDKDSALECAGTLLYAFPCVDVICEQTGEVMYSRFVSPDWFEAEREPAKAIFEARCGLCF